MIKGFFIFLLIVFSIASYAQVNSIRQAQNRMVEGKWETARTLLKKALRKDTSNVEAKLVLAEWFFATGNPSQQIDSAYLYLQTALTSFSTLAPKQKEKLSRVELDSNRLLLFRSKIDSTAFEHAKQLNTERSYTDFLQHFRYAKERAVAVELRDEIGFLQALKINTWQSFDGYLQTYPQSHRRVEAQARVDKLLFEDKTRDHRLESYQLFINAFPSSPFALHADQMIFEIATANGSIESFEKFIQLYPRSKKVNFARNLLFYLYVEREQTIPAFLLSDSIQSVIESNKGYWVSVLQNGKFGFLDSLGREVIAPQFQSIDPDYLCGTVRENILVTSNGLINRQGKKISESFPLVKDLGSGFLAVGDSACFQIIHKSGRRIISPCVQDAKVLGGFLAIKKKERWGVYSFTGRPLLPPAWNKIQLIENVLVFDRQEKRILCTPEQVGAVANGKRLPEELVFDEARLFGKQQLLVRNGAMEGIINSQLNFVVPLTRQTLIHTPYGMVRKIDDKYVVTELSKGLDTVRWDKIVQRTDWLILQKDKKENLYSLSRRKIVAAQIDSIKVEQGLAFVYDRDSLRIYLPKSKSITFSRSTTIHFVNSKDSIQYFYSDGKNKKEVVEIHSGRKRFSVDFDKIELLSGNIFLVGKKGKWGLLSKDGMPLLPLEFDALIQNANGLISLLKDKKFGIYDSRKKKLINPVYDQNVVLFATDVLGSAKNKLFGLFGWDGKPLSKFEFDEILPWTDKTIWVRKGIHWQLLEFRTGKTSIDKVKEIKPLIQLPSEQAVLINRDNNWGVVSSIRGVVIPPTYSSIVNIGSDEFPLYFTDKEVREAGVHVVIYYNHEGKFIRKQVYEEDEFENIYCEDN